MNENMKFVFAYVSEYYASFRTKNWIWPPSLGDAKSLILVWFNKIQKRFLCWIEDSKFRLAVRPSFAFINSNWEWLKQFTWFISHKIICCLQMLLQRIERVYVFFYVERIYYKLNCPIHHASLLCYSKYKFIVLYEI